MDDKIIMIIIIDRTYAVEPVGNKQSRPVLK